MTNGKAISGRRMCNDKVVRTFVRLDKYPIDTLVKVAAWLKANLTPETWYVESVRVGDWRDNYSTFRQEDKNIRALERYVDPETRWGGDTAMEIIYFDNDDDAMNFKLTWG